MGAVRGERLDVRRAGVAVVQPSARDHRVEQAHRLGAEAALELPATADRVLSGNAALFVGGGPQRQVGVAVGDAVPGLDAVACGIDIRQVGFHAPRDLERAVESGLHPGVGAERRLRARADDDEHQVDTPRKAAAAAHGERVPVGVDALDPSLGDDLDPVPAKLGPDPRAKVRIDGGQHARHRLNHSDAQAPSGQGLGHLHADIAAADDQDPLMSWARCAGAQEVIERQGVAHPAQRKDAGQVDPRQVWAD